MKARASFEAGEISTERLRAVEDDAIQDIVRMQEALGLRAATDGEFRRRSWQMDFIHQLGGLSSAPGEEQNFAFRRTDGSTIVPPMGDVRVTGKITLDETIFGDHFASLQAMAASALPKLTIPSLNQVYLRGGRGMVDRSVYPDLDEFWHDLVAAYREELRGLHALGCAYLQLDDVSIAVLNDPAQRDRMAQLGEDGDHIHLLFIRRLNEVLAGRPPGMTVTTHLCRGNYRSSWAAQGSYDFVAEPLFSELEVDGFFLEFDDERSGGFEPLRFVPKGRMVVLGLVTTKRGELESKDELKRRIEEASRHVPLEQLCLSPQCGFASASEGNDLTYEQQVAKLRLVVETAEEVWG
jgi:5-methyltetrahydropteroyltriglutamate--homocysteine methyltransferase